MHFKDEYNDFIIFVFQALLNYEAQVESRSNQGATPLHLAVCMGHQDIVCTLIKSGASVNFQSLPGISFFLTNAHFEACKNALSINQAQLVVNVRLSENYLCH